MVLSKHARTCATTMLLLFSLVLSAATAGCASEIETTAKVDAVGLDTVAARQKQMVAETKSSAALMTAPACRP